jgi:hypothetical protein
MFIREAHACLPGTPSHWTFPPVPLDRIIVCVTGKSETSHRNLVATRGIRAYTYRNRTSKVSIDSSILHNKLEKIAKLYN